MTENIQNKNRSEDKKKWYLIEVNDPALLGQWGQIEEEVIEIFDTEEAAQVELAGMKAMLRFAGTGATYYRVKDQLPQKRTPLPPYDPSEHGPLTEEEY